MKFLKYFENIDFDFDDFDEEEFDEYTFSNIRELYDAINTDISNISDDIFVRFVTKGEGPFKKDTIIIEDNKHRKDIMIISTYGFELKTVNNDYQIKFMNKQIVYSSSDNKILINKIFDEVKKMKKSIDTTGVFDYKTYI